MPAFPVEVQLSEAGPPDTGWATRPFNLSGHPALTLPCGATAAGLPVGMQLAGRAFDEATLLRIAHAYEESTRWHTRRPPVKEAA
jgi:Asp-tRNA(Asn)/Glu-tRNA(Gln) amidotransferase A subunit family amidase